MDSPRTGDTPSPENPLLADRYALGEPIDRGRSTVFRATDTRLQRHVAIKEVRLYPGFDDHDQVRSWAMREAQAAARLISPGVVTMYDIIEERGSLWLVMELVEGRSLSRLVADEGPLDHVRAARIGLEVLGALEAAHAVEVIHRDVKPANVLVTAGDRVKLADFGVATIRDETRVTSTGTVLGSPAYMAPEQARGEKAGPAADLWALGATLYFAVEGHPPFSGDSPLATASAVVHGDPRPPARPGPLTPIIRRLLVKDVARRLDAPQLRPLLQTMLHPGGEHDRPARRTARWRARRGRTSPAAAGLGAARVPVRPAAPRAPAARPGRLSGEPAAPDPTDQFPTAAPPPAGDGDAALPVTQPVATGAGDPAGPLAAPVGEPAAEPSDEPSPQQTAAPATTPREPDSERAEGASTEQTAPFTAAPREPDGERAEGASTEEGSGDGTAGAVPPAAPADEGDRPDPSPPGTGGPTPARRPSARRPKGRQVALLLVGVLVAGAAIWAVAGRDDAPRPAGDPSTTTPAAARAGDAPAGGGATTVPAGAAPTTATTIERTGTTGASGTLPEGWIVYEGDTYTIGHPAGWEIRPAGGPRIDIRDPETGSYLRVDWTDEPRPDPVADWRQQAGGFAARHDGYEEIRIEAADYRDYDAAVWEFRYRDGGAVLHVANLGFVANGRGYALYFQTRDDRWAASQDLLARFRESFQPAPPATGA